MRVRRYSPDDAAACRALWAELTAHHRELYEDASIGGPDPGSHFDPYLERAAAVWVAEEDGRVLGFAGLLLHGSHGELEPIAVARDRRGQGVGHALAEAVVEEARRRGLQQLRVQPAARNSDAIRFFHELGFSALGQIELVMDLDQRTRRPGEPIAGREFLV